MAKNTRYSDIDFSRFEPPAQLFEQNAARQLAPKPAASPQKPPMRLVERKKKTVAEARREMQVGGRQALKILAVSVFLLSLFAVLLYGRLRVDELSREVDAAAVQLQEAQDAYTRLNMKLDADFSLERVEAYARDVLGMTKAEGYQIEHIDLSGEDAVVVSGDKQVSPDGEEPSVVDRVLAYLKSK